MADICEDCIRGNRLPGTPTGSMVKISTFDAYYAATPAGNAAGSEKKAIVLFTDVFGLPLGNPKLMADEYAARVGCDVYVPDMFNGFPPVSSEAMEPYDHYENTPLPLFKKLGMAWTFMLAIPKIWWGSNFPGQVAARMKKFLEALKAEKGFTNVGVVGFCYGGIVIIRLAGADLYTTAVICHPGNSSKEERAKINVPVSWICAEDDFSFPPIMAHETEAMFAARTGTDKVEYEFKEYKGCKHGFAARPALHIPTIKEAFEDAKERTIAWFQKTL